MKLKKSASVGSLELNDIKILIQPSDNGITTVVVSNMGKNNEEEIKKMIKSTLESLNVESVEVIAIDNGAIEAVIKSRVETAAYISAEWINKK